MRLTDEDLRSLFPHGMLVFREDQRGEGESVDDMPLHGSVGPHHENPDWFNLWITDGANTVFTREVQPEGDGSYLNDRLGVAYRFRPVPAP